MEKKIQYIILYFIIVSALIFLILNSVLSKNKDTKQIKLVEENIPVYHTCITYLYDTSTPELAVGAADYVFIAKINNIEKTDYRDPIEVEIMEDNLKTKTVYSPYTIYDITIVENIKGNLTKNKNIELEQMGGLDRDRNFYIFPEKTFLLESGKYYILLAYAPFENGNLQINNPTSIVKLSDIENQSDIKIIKSIAAAKTEEEISNIKNQNSENKAIEVVSQYKSALLNQIIPEGRKNNKAKYDLYYTN